MGQLLSGGATRQATTSDIRLYERMRVEQAKQPVPILQNLQNQHEYLFVALFDGTGQDVRDPKQLPTNIGQLQEQAKKLKSDPSGRFGSAYVEGIGTQRNSVSRLLDGAVAYTWDDKIQKMYRDLADQTLEWRQKDPNAQIRAIEVGYSRGAVLVPGFARLVDKYGIAHPDGLKFGRDVHGNLTVESSSTLVPPGQVAQAIGLMDPVGTNLPASYDARPPKSVLSGYSQIAKDEQRELFPHKTILDPDWSDDGRFLSTPVPGGHSNVGGGNKDAGLEVLAFNGMVDYLNSLTDRPLFEHRPVLADPEQYTIYQAQGVTAAFGLRMDEDGERNLSDELANCKIVDVCRDAEPVDVELARQFEWQRVQTVPERMPTLPEPAAPSMSLEEKAAVKPKSPADQILEDYLSAMRAGDDLGMSKAASAMARSEFGQQRIAEAKQDVEEKREAIPGRDHPLFEQAVHHLEQLGPDAAGYWNRTELEQMAGSIAYKAQRNHMPAIDELHATPEGGNLFATWSDPRQPVLRSHVAVDKVQAMSQPLEQSLNDLAKETQQQEQMAQVQALERAQQQHRGMSR